MKKLLILLGIFFMFISVEAQHDMIVSDGANYAVYTGDANDTVYNAGGTFDIVFYIKQAVKSRYTISYLIDGDTLTGCTGNTTIQPKGSYDGVTFDNIGSAVTWTSSSAVYCANVNIHAMTSTVATYNMYVSDSTFEDETVAGEDTITVAAQTQTLNFAGVDYRYIQILITGASDTKVEIDKVAIKVTPIYL
jgi:hypothetical protein